MKYVMFYESSDDVLAKAREHYGAHAEHARVFHTKGSLLLIGTFADPQRDGAMGVFTTREAAEEFAASDPFVLSGVVREYQIREWNEILDVSAAERNGSA